MGCDIHAHAEVRINGKWEHYSDLHIKRNYELFARMANVRNHGDVEPISEPRGIPEDATFLTKFDFARWGIDAHSASWLSGVEIECLGDWIKTRPFYGPNRLNWWVNDATFASAGISPIHRSLNDHATARKRLRRMTTYDYTPTQGEMVAVHSSPWRRLVSVGGCSSMRCEGIGTLAYFHFLRISLSHMG